MLRDPRSACPAAAGLTALTALGAVVAVVAVVVAAACGRRVEATPRNLLLISIDTLRPDMLGCYGHPRPTSPTLDALARGGALFEDANAPAPWTAPSHASLLTGTWPDRHGIIDQQRRLPDALETLASVLQARGMTTAAIVGSHNVGERFGFDRGFDSFDRVPEQLGRRAPTEVEARALHWIAEHDGSPFFLFLHYYDVHSDYASLPEVEQRFVAPYDGAFDGSTWQLLDVREGKATIGPSDARHLVQLYEAGIRQLDDGLARLLEALDARGLREDTLIVVVSDHGEEFLEHGGVLHGRTQYREVLSVPWILSGPGVPAGTRVAAPVSLVDVLPTCLALLGHTVPDGLDGMDVSPALRGDAEALPAGRVLFGSADHLHPAGDDLTRSARRGRWKLVLDGTAGTSRLYDLQADPAERVDASEGHEDVVEALRAQLAAYDAVDGHGDLLPPLAPEEAERLRALGY